jgi:Chitobiase/beta-hexosaminidase C-terminal domain
MRTFLLLATLVVPGISAQGQDAGTIAVQQASQQATMAAQQATQQAMQNAQLASQNAQLAQQQASQQASQAARCYRCGEATPKFSVKPGNYSSAVTVKIRDAGRGAVIYYTTDGWTPTASSTRYTGPITIDSTTTLQAIAVSPYGGRSRLATAVYTLDGVPPVQAAARSAIATTSSGSNAGPAASKVLLAQGTPVPLMFAADVSSRTADVGDKISVTLAEDLEAGGLIVAKKGTPTVATVTEVDKSHVLGTPGEVFFQVDSLDAGGTVIKLHGGAAKQGEDEYTKAASLMVIPVPVALFVHGKDAEIKQGAQFTAFVDADTLLPPSN